ncbi:MAG: Pycsar system effector family protein [Planctomycetota bacterium]
MEEQENAAQQESAAQTAFLWNTLCRIDGYVTSTNSKSAMLLAYETFLLGAFILKAGDFLTLINCDWLQVLLGVLIGVFGVSCVVSLLLALSVVQPFLKSNSRPGQYYSQIYFGDIADTASSREFLELVRESDAASRLDDLAQQIHIVATAAHQKFGRLRWATRSAVFVQCPILLVLLAARLFGT